MSNLVLGWPNHSDVATLYGDYTGWPTHPVENLQDRRLHRTYRTPTASPDDTVISMVLGGGEAADAQSLGVIGLLRHNLTVNAQWRMRGLMSSAIFASNDFNGWTNLGTPVVTTSQTDPLGAARASIITDDSTTSAEGKRTAVTFTGDGTKSATLTLKRTLFTTNYFGIYDSTATAYRHLVSVAWGVGGTPTVTTVTGSGSIAVIALSADWYCIAITAASVVAANANQFRVYPVNPSVITSTGSMTAYEALAFNYDGIPIVGDTGLMDCWSFAWDAEDYDDRPPDAVYVYPTAISAPQMSVELSDASNPDGYLDVGRLVIASKLTPTFNADYGAQFGLVNETTSRYTDGGVQTAARRPSRRTLKLALSNVAEDEALTSWLDYGWRAGPSGQVLIVSDPADTTHLSLRSFLATPTTLPALTEAQVRRYGIPLAFVEEL